MASFYTEISNKVSIEFAPWTDDCKFLIDNIHIKESLGGEIAGGNVNLRMDATNEEALKFVTEQNTGIIRIKDNRENGLSYEIPVYIHSRNHLFDTIQLDVLCISDLDFITKKNTVSFDDIDSAIDKLYKGTKDIRTKPDSGVTSIPEYQRCMSDYDFCTRLCCSYKKNIVFGYGWEGLLIKDVTGVNSFGNDEPDDDLVILNGGDFSAVSTQKLTYNSNLTEERKPFFPFQGSDLSLTQGDYSEFDPKYVTSMMFGEEYHIIGQDYKAHLENWKYNSKLLSSDFYYNLKIKGRIMPSFKLGDNVKFVRASIGEGAKESSNPFDNYIVKSNEFFYSDDKYNVVDDSGMKFSWTSLLVGLDKGDWTEIKEEG
jgi:hypothetical protein